MFRGWMIRSSPPEDRPLVFSKDESEAKKSSLIIEEGNQTDLVSDERDSTDNELNKKNPEVKLLEWLQGKEGDTESNAAVGLLTNDRGLPLKAINLAPNTPHEHLWMSPA